MQSELWMSDDCSRFVGPTDCALVVGVPMTKADFLGTLAEPDRWDLAASQLAEFPRHTPAIHVWERFDREVASAVRTACSMAEKAGVTVSRWASLSDLTAILNRPRETRPKVVTLVSHWISADLTHDDILHPKEIQDQLYSPDPRHPIVDALRHQLQVCHGSDGSIEGLTVRQLTDDLVGIVKAAHSQIRDPSSVPSNTTWLSRLRDRLLGRPYTHPTPRHANTNPVTRAALERAFPLAIRPATAIEFRDGLWTVDDLIAAIPAEFDGTIDLGYCNTTLVGQAVKERARASTVMMRRFRILYTTWAALYPVVIATLEKSRHAGWPMSYSQAIRAVWTNAKCGGW